MKKIFATTLWLASLCAAAQITNPGFETWNGTQPQGWENSNGDGDNTSVISSNDAHSGSRAIQLSVVQVFGINLPGTITQMDIPLTSVPSSLRFWMESSFPNDALLLVSATVSDANANPLAYATSFVSNDYNNYTEVAVPFEVVATGTPTKVDIIFSIGSQNGDLTELVDAVVRLDDVSLSNIPVNVEEQTKSEMEIIVYPNPASGDFVTLQTDFKGAVDISIVDMTGKLVFQQNMLNVDTAGNIGLDISSLASGFYSVHVRGNGAEASVRLKKE